MKKIDFKLPKDFVYKTDETRNQVIREKFGVVIDVKKNGPKKKN